MSRAWREHYHGFLQARETNQANNQGANNEYSHDDEVRDLLGSSESISREKAEARYRYADIMIAAKI